jgi:hypothetical protein
MAQLQDVAKAKPRGKADENLIAEITRLESSITVTRDDLVSVQISFDSLVAYNGTRYFYQRAHASCV